MLRNHTLIPALIALGLAGAATAAQSPEPPAPATPPAKLVNRAEAAPQTRMSVHVNGIVLEELRSLVPDEAKLGPLFLRMVLVAKQEAIGASCDAYTVDQKRMVAVMLGTIAPAVEGLDKDKTQSTINALVRQYHTMLGGELAAAGFDQAGYCTAGKELFDQISGNVEKDKILVLMPAA
jgi:hypothetical protein